MRTGIDEAALGRADQPTSAMTLSPRAAVVAFAALLLVFIAVFWFFFQAQIRSAMHSPSDWGHVLVIPFISGYFVWLKRDELLREPFRPGWTGILPMAIGIGIYFLGYLGPKSLLVHANVRGAGVGLALFGVVILLFGWRSLRVLWFPLAYWVVFGQVISDALIKPVTEDLQDISARGAWALLNLVGVDTERDGNVLTVFSAGVAKQLNVAEACSGMRMLLAFLALGVAIAYTGLPRWWQRAILIAAGVPVAVGVNVLRVMTLGVLSIWDINFAAGEFHNIIGLIWLVPAFLFYMGIRWVLSNLLIEDASGETNAESSDGVRSGRAADGGYRFARAGRIAYGCAFGVLLCASLGFRGAVAYLGYYLIKEPVPLRAPIDTIPIGLGSWERLGKDNILSATMVEELGTQRYLDRMYVHEKDRGRGGVQVHIAYYTGTIDDVPHVPERCWGVAGYEQLGSSEIVEIPLDRSGWNLKSGVINRATGIEYATVSTPDPITGRPVDVSAPIGDVRLRITQFQDPKKPKRRLIGGYLFIANGRLTPDAYGVRRLAFERTERFAYYCKVQFSMDIVVSGEGESAIPIFRENANELFNALLPHLMARLPDWPTIERRAEADGATAAAAARPAT